MSLGGYKFAGYKCTKASGMSNADLALLIHKTRLKAFVEACAKANANWHFCKNSGTHDFEGETGVIYNIIGVTSDFVSFFQYENENKYFAIITCPEISDGIFHDKARGKGYYEGDNTNRYLWTYRTMFHCASVSPLDADFFIKQDSGGVATYPSGALPIIPISTFYLNTSPNVCHASDNGKWFSYPRDGFYDCFGYAVKGSNIITFAVQDYPDNDYIATGQIFVNVIGFDAMKLSSQADNYNVFHVSLNMQTTNTNECVYVKKNANWHITKSQQTLKSDGTLYAESEMPSSLFLNTMSLASYVYGVSTDIPYASMRLVTHENANSEMRTSTPLLNIDGITSKGDIDIDLMACNVTNGYASLKACGAYANGNYLLACKDYGGYQQYYVGWDASNPDITLDASWTEYVDDDE